MNTAKCVSCRATQLAGDIDPITGWGICCLVKKINGIGSVRALKNRRRSNRNWNNQHIEKYREYRRRWKLKNEKRSKAQSILNHAIERGEIYRPLICSKCGAERRIEGHHENYEFPLDVTWLCYICHAEIHRRKKSQKGEVMQEDTRCAEIASSSEGEGVARSAAPDSRQLGLF